MTTLHAAKLPNLVMAGLYCILTNACYKFHPSDKSKAIFEYSPNTDHFTLTVSRRGQRLSKTFAAFDHIENDDIYHCLGDFVAEAKTKLAEWPNLLSRC